jgi:hypothetical protein
LNGAASADPPDYASVIRLALSSGAAPRRTTAWSPQATNLGEVRHGMRPRRQGDKMSYLKTAILLAGLILHVVQGAGLAQHFGTRHLGSLRGTTTSPMFKVG